MKANDDQGICYPQPHSLAQRIAIAADFTKRFHYRIPLAVDAMDNRADALYAGWPERIYVVDENGRVAYKGKTGPFGFHPEELEAWLSRRFPAAAASPSRNSALPGGV